MATETDPRTLDAENSAALINAQLKRTRSQVKGVEFGQRILKLVVGVLAFFLLATLLDHWVVSEGLPIWARVVLWLTLIGGVIWYAVKALLPLLLYRVNPLYAARTIEETKPSLKNSLINYLTLSSEQNRLPTVIYDAIAKQAARGVKDASVEHAVDRAPLIRWGYLLLGLTFCFALYFVISPKNPFRTVARVIVPWADLTAPSRVQIVEVTPGSTLLYRGKSVQVAARIEGLAEDETATLHYTTADGQQREQPIKLKLDELRNYTTLLPVLTEKNSGIAAPPRELAGLQQDFEYYITAGDARSNTFHVQVAPAPYIGVERIEYKYPAYTKLPPETRQGEVDVQALEGTTVTIHGTANQPLKRAWIELRDDAGTPRLFPEMKIADQTASGSWKLGWKDAALRDQPDYPTYALRFKNQHGDDNPEPIAYGIKVLRDEPPTIDILSPSSAEVSVPWDQPIDFEVRAQDPDFAIIDVQLLGMRGEKIAFTQNIASFAAMNAHQGNLQKKVSYTPKVLGLQVGDVIDYWATATDNKVPNPNIAQTVPRKLRVIEAQKGRNPKDDPLAQNQPQNNQNPPQNNNGQRDPNQKGQPGDQQPHDPNQPQNQPPMGNQGDPNNDQANNGQGNFQPPSDPTAQNDQDPDNQPKNPNDPRQQQPNKNNALQDKPNQDPNQQQNDPNYPKQQQTKGGDANKSGSQQNNAKPQPNNDPSKGDKSGEQQPSPGKKSDDTQQQDQPQNGEQKQAGSEKNPQSGDQSAQPEQNQQPSGRPQEKDNKVNPDGTNDGDAFARAMENLKNEFNKKPEQKQPEQQANNQSPQNQTNDPKQSPQATKQGKQEPEKQEPGKQNETGKPEAGKQDSSKDASGKQQSGKPESGKESGKQDGKSASSKDPGAQQSGSTKSGDPGKQEPGSQAADKQPTDPKNSGQQQPAEQSPNGTGQKPDLLNPQQQSGPGDQAGEQQAGKPGPGEKPEPGAKADQGAKPEPGGKQPGEKSPNEKGQGKQRENPEKTQPGANGKEPNPQGSKPGNATEPENNQKSMSKEQQGDMGNPSGSPKPQEKGKSNANPSSSSANKNDDSNKAESPSTKPNDSASKGDEGGDRKGGGKKGGGQPDNKAGRGAAGKNTEDEKGASTGKEQGDGETGTKAGDQQTSTDKTGKSGQETGKGTDQKQGDGQQPGGTGGKNKPEGKAEQSGKEPGEHGSEPNAQTGNPREQKGKNGPPGNIPGGGGNSDAPAVPPEYNGPLGDSPEDKANDAYAKRATDLVLEQMKNQLRSGNVDQDLLNKLGWTKAEMQQFVDRWDAMKREAQQPGPVGDAAAVKLQDRLRSLGLRPEQSSTTGDNVGDDDLRGNRVNRRSAPPSEYRDIYRAFQKGASGG